MSSIRIIFLGTSSAIPTSTRGLSSVAVIRDGVVHLFDAGEGIQSSFIQNKIGLNKETHIFITHMHGDHCIGILGLIQSMSLSSRTLPLYIYGPYGLGTFIENSFISLKFKPKFPIIIKNVRSGSILSKKDYFVKAQKGLHSVTNFAFTLEEYNRPGKFHLNKIKKLGVPEGKQWSNLQKGKSIIFKGKKIHSREVVDEPRPGRKIGISGDTRPTKSLLQFFKNSDVLIFESTYSKIHQDLAIERFHSTSNEAALLAKKSKSTVLILTHFSARYSNTDELLQNAKKIHLNTIAAKDDMKYNIPSK